MKSTRDWLRFCFLRHRWFVRSTRSIFHPAINPLLQSASISACLRHETDARPMPVNSTERKSTQEFSSFASQGDSKRIIFPLEAIAVNTVGTKRFYCTVTVPVIAEP